MDGPLHRLRQWFAETPIFKSARSRRRFVLHLTVAVVLLAGLTVLVHRHLNVLTDAEALRAFIRRYGIWGPLVLVALQTGQVVLAPIPGQILAVVAGYLFGAWWGTLYNMIGITIGSAIAFWIARRYGRAYVEGIVHEEALDQFDAIDDDYAGLTLFLLFLFPGLPDDVLCFAGGLTTIPLWKLVVIAIVGRAPAFFLVNVVGDFVGTGQFLAALVLTAALLALSALAFLNRDRLVGYFGESE
jgi:uncharacterized membrane protein YdjX (TVP38/TMEM64 family)